MINKIKRQRLGFLDKIVVISLQHKDIDMGYGEKMHRVY